MPRVWECGIRSASVVGMVFLGSGAPCDAWSHHESMSCWPFPGNHRHPPGPALTHERFSAFLANAALCSPVGPVVLPAAPPIPAGGHPGTYRGWATRRVSFLCSLSALRTAPTGGSSRAENFSWCCSWRVKPSHRNNGACKLI